MYDFAVSIAVEDLPPLLKLLRDRQRKTLEQVAEETGIAVSTLGGYENGAVPPLRKFVALLAHYGVTDFGLLHRELAAMRGEKVTHWTEPGESAPARTAEEMLRNAPKWARFAIEGMAGRLEEYEDEIRRLRNEDGRGPHSAR